MTKVKIADSDKKVQTKQCDTIINKINEMSFKLDISYLVKRTNMQELQSNDGHSSYMFRKPKLEDCCAVHKLISDSRPLDLNSLYSYLILSAHFNDTCIVAELDGNIAGYISAYVQPRNKDTLFVWQVAVSEAVRNQGIATRMLGDLIKRPEMKSIRYLETTVNPSNHKSRHLFESFARTMNSSCHKSILFPRHLFGKLGHEEEILFRVGPFSYTETLL